MTNISQDLRTYLLTKTTVTDLVGTRIYYSHLPQRATLPAIVLDVIEQRSERDIDANDGMARSVVDIVCYGSTYSAAYSLSEAVRLVVDQYDGTLGSTYADEIIVDMVTDAEDSPIDGSDTHRFLRSLSTIIWHTESLPTT